MVRSEVMEVDRADQELSDKEKERSKRSEREKDRGREKEKDKEKSKDHREKDRDREKEKDRAKEKERERVKEKEREREKDRGRDRGRDREKEREKDKDKDRHRERIGHGHDKEHETVKDKERHHDKSGHGREKDHDIAREKHREKSPHETDVKKEKSRDADREKEKSKAKEGDREKEKDREKHGAREKTRDRDEKVKEKHSDRDRSKDEEKDKDREKHNGREKTREKDEKVKEKHSERDKGKDEEKDKERDKHGAREKTRDKDEKAKEKHSERDKSKDEEKEKREREKEREKEKAKEREREKDKEREREKEKEREKERERERERERDREERERDRERERERENEKERERQRIRHREHEHERESEREYDQERDQRTKDMDIDDNRGPEREHGRDSDQQHASNSELADRLARMREERRKANFDRRPGRRSIRASEKPEDVDDIASWVNKSRQLDEKKKAEEREKAARMAKALEEQENEEGDSDEEFRPSSKYSAKDLAGLKVRHGLDKVMEGGAVVLTLKDTSILADGDVNDETDELENLELAQQTAREDAYKAAKKVAGKYEDKFNNDMTGNKTILSKYDDAIKEEGVTLDESGGVDEEAHRKLEEVRKRLQHGMGDRLAESLLTTTSTIASEYFTQDEMTTFKKPKKKKKLRKKEKLDLDALEIEAVAEGLGTTDMGSRDTISRRAVMQDEMKAAADARRERYENAVAKAADASRILKEESEANAIDVDETEEVIVGAEEEEVLAKSLDRARQAALKKQADIASGPQTIAARLAAAKQELSQAQGDGDAEEGKLIFSDTGEFCRSLQLDEALIRRSAPKDVFHEEEKEEGELDPLDEEAPGTAPVRGGWTEVGDVEMTDNIKEIPEMEEDSLDEVKEVAVGKGLAGVLQLLKERGSLKETVDWGGRNMDKKKSKLVGIVDESNNVVGQRDILLDRVDEFGRTMTPKEAFRKLSHKFHGKGPGKMKQEKRQKQFQEELKLKQMNAGDTPLMAMEKIREAQAKLNAPYLVISGHIKPGQTSDPRSGFATVEKEPVGSLTPMLGDNKNIGSLTPMLGDKKVAHFLGIKRKPESGSMGPPPNKKPKDH